jgi:hypothetical protein
VGRNRYWSTGVVEYQTASLGIEVTAADAPTTSTSRVRVTTVPVLEVAVSVTG